MEHVQKTMKDDDYMDICNYFKTCIKQMSNLTKFYDGRDIYVQVLSDKCLLLSHHLPTKPTTENLPLHLLTHLATIFGGDDGGGGEHGVLLPPFEVPP